MPQSKQPDYGKVKPDVPGNIQWYGRQRVPMPGNKYGTVYSESANENGLEVLYPRIYDGALHSSDEAWQHYKETGEHMGKFKSIADADYFAQKYHEDAAAGKYDLPKGKNMPDNMTELKRAQEVFDRPSKTAPTPTPKSLQSSEPVTARPTAAPAKPAASGEISKSLDYRKQQMKALDSFAKGTPNVPKSGIYKLEAGEAVIPKHMNWMNPDGMSGLNGKAKPAGKVKVVKAAKKVTPKPKTSEAPAPKTIKTAVKVTKGK